MTGGGTTRAGATQMESGCIACSGADHSHLTCVHVGAALHRWMLQLGPGKDMTLVVDIILRLLMWGWREARCGEPIMRLSYTPGGNIISAGGQDGSVFFMSAQTGEKILCLFRSHSKDNTECICEFYPSGNLKKSRAECPLSGHSQPVSCLAFKPGDPNILVSGSWDMTLKIWDLSTAPACLLTVTVDSGFMGIQSVSFSPIGDMIVAGCGNGKIYFIDAQSGEVKRALTVDSRVLSVAFSPDGDMIAAGCGNGKIHLVDALTGQVKRSVRGHNGQDGCICHVDEDGDRVGAVNTQCPVNAHSDCVNAVSWSHCGKWLASGGDDKMVYIYDAQTLEVKCPVSGHSDW